jgi:hypothetical protein
VERAEDFEWSSARAHTAAGDFGEMLDSEWWQPRWSAGEWRTILTERRESAEELRAIREATYSGRPFGSKQFVAGLEERLGRKLELRTGGRSKEELLLERNQMSLWTAK